MELLLQEDALVRKKNEVKREIELIKFNKHG